MSVLDSTMTVFRTAPRRLLDGILPPLCLACDAPLTEPGLLCGRCWQDIHFLAPPWCRACGHPFEYDSGPEALCGPCSREAPAYDRARAAMRYDGASKRLVVGFKHADRTEAAGSFAAWLERSGSELLAEAELATAVPLHWRRLFKRRYNQAALLARALAGRRDGLAFRPDLLLRTRATPPQGRLSRSQRRRNIAGAIAANPRRRGEIAGRRILLVDDVMTTGATVEACSKALKGAGAAAVDVLVLARVLLPEP